MKSNHSIIGIVVCCAFTTLVLAKDAPELTSEQVKDGLYMISGDGGNMAYFAGPEGSLLIDDAFAHSYKQIRKQISKIGGDAPTFVVNTHFHSDHAGSNEAFGEDGSIIVGHRNVRQRLASGTRLEAFDSETPPAKPVALPSITYTDAIDLYLNGETVSLFHVKNAHTDGDSFLKFVGRNVIHTGDLLFNGFFPFIDTQHGGSLAGMIKAQKAILDTADDNTVIIPGHGPITDKAGLKRNREMLKTALARLVEARKADKTLEQVIAENPLADLDAAWGQRMFTSERWISIVYGSVKAADEWCCIDE